MNSVLRTLYNGLAVIVETVGFGARVVAEDIGSKKNLDRYMALIMILLTTKLMDGYPGIQNLAAVLLSGYFGYRCINVT
jgi:hypothetical protein